MGKRKKIIGYDQGTDAASKPGATSAQCRSHPAVALRGRSGFSLVELLVVMLIFLILAIGMGMAVARALTIEQNYREEAGVRSSLAHQLAYAERYVSLAIDFDDTNKRASFPPEVGGISWETGHWIRVTSADLLLTNRQFGFRVTSADTRKLSEQKQLFSPDGFLYSSSARVTNAFMEGAGSVRRLVIQADYQIRTPEGVETNSIEVSRPIRLWNQ
jgi:prepilin-type N-terminal cleavage/methylation domain-containing protein